MGIFDDEVNKLKDLDETVIKSCNEKNAKCIHMFEGWVRRDSVSYVIAKDGSLKPCPKSSTYEVGLHVAGDLFSNHNSTIITIESSSLSSYKDKTGLQRFKINRPSLPVIITRKLEIPDTFMFDVPEGTKEVTFLSFFDRPLKTIPKVKGNVKVNYINRATAVHIKRNEKINVMKWWAGCYERTFIDGSKVVKK